MQACSFRNIITCRNMIIMKNKLAKLIGFSLILMTTTTACSTTTDNITSNSGQTVNSATTTSQNANANISLNTNEISVSGTGVTVDGTTATITKAGTYAITGSIEEVQLCIDCEDDAEVTLSLQGITMTNSMADCIFVKNAGKVTILLADNTQNTLTSGEKSNETTEEENETTEEESLDKSVKSAIYASSDLTISGNGSLIVNGYINNGIQSKSNILVESGTLEITASNDGIKGKNSVSISDGTFSLTTVGDGITSDGSVQIDNGQYTITTGNGATTHTTNMEFGSNLSINAEGDGIDSNGSIYITGGYIYVDGPSNSGNSAIDIGTENQGICEVSGGKIIALGFSGMAEAFSSTSTQNSFLYVFDSTLAADSVITITDASGNELDNITTAKACDSIIYSSNELTDGSTYTIHYGDQTGELSLSGSYTTNNTRRW